MENGRSKEWDRVKRDRKFLQEMGRSGRSGK